MAILFDVDASQAWFTSRWTGPLTDEEILTTYLEFHRGAEWKPGMGELVDLTQADMSRITADGLAALATAITEVFDEANVSAARTAVYSETDLPFGLARLYEAYTLESPESVQVFRDRDEALGWLLA